MATFRALVAIDMLDMKGWTGELIQATTSQIVIRDGFRTGVYEGSFTYGSLSGVSGTLESLNEFRGYNQIYSVTDIGSDFKPIYSAIETETYAYHAASLIMDGNDQFTGSSGADHLLSFSGNDRIEAGAGDDLVEAGDGADFVRGGMGDDIIFGGAGDDLVEFRIAHGAATISSEGERTTVVSPLGTDTLTGVETLRFDDGDVAVEGTGGFTVSGTVRIPDGSAFDGAELTFTPENGSASTQVADAGGGFAFEIEAGSSGSIDLLTDGGEAAQGISAVDALEVLRIAVGLEPGFGPAQPIDLIAADVTGNGRVSAADALGVLRYAVGLDAGDAGARVLLDDGADLSGVTAQNVAYDTGAAISDLSGDLSLAFTAVTLGDPGTVAAL